MLFQSTLIFIRFLLYMVHPTKSLASVGLAQAHPNYELLVWYTVGYKYNFIIMIEATKKGAKNNLTELRTQKS